jgi:ubiquinol-cytochrome c reductase cytochrome c1 subunit
MAKDVTTFLSWAAEPEHDERKKIGIKAVILFSTLTAISLYVKRFKWNVIKNRKMGESYHVLLRVWLKAPHLVYNPPVDKTH